MNELTLGNVVEKLTDELAQSHAEVARLTARVKELETEVGELDYLDSEATIGANEMTAEVKRLATEVAGMRENLADYADRMERWLVKGNPQPGWYDDFMEYVKLVCDEGSE